MKRKSLFLLAGIAVMSLLALPSWSAAKPEQAPKEKVIYRTFAVKDFTALNVSGAVKVIYAQGPLRVTAKGTERDLSFLKITQSQGKLRVQTNSKVSVSRHPKKVTVYVTVPHLTDLSVGGASKFKAGRLQAEGFQLLVAGASDVEIGDLDCQSLKAEANGASGLKLKGTAKECILKCTGSSDADLKLQGKRLTVSNSGASEVDLEFQGGDVVVDCTGSSEASLTVSCRQLKVKCTGASEASVAGTAQQFYHENRGASSINHKALIVTGR